MFKSKPKLVSRNGLIAVAGVYLFLMAGLWAFQERVVFSPASKSTGNWAFCEHAPGVTEIKFETVDGKNLVGWFAKHDQAKLTILLFHGAAENIAMLGHEISTLRKHLQANIMVFDYRGFGKSEGSPTEQGLILDGQAAMRKLNELTDTMPSEVLIIGRSLGGGPALRTAIDLGAKGLVLHSTYAALDDLCANKMWFMPVRLLIRIHFRSIDWIKNYQGPVLVAHGTDDRLIPFENSERLFAASKSRKKYFLKQESRGHHDALTSEFLKEVSGFANGL